MQFSQAGESLNVVACGLKTRSSLSQPQESHAGQFHRFTQRVAGDSADFVCGARAMGLACSLPTGLADSVNTGGIGTGRESATSNYLDASGHTKTLQ